MAAEKTTPSLFDSSDSSAPGYYGPSQTALLLLDFHQLFIEQAGGADAPAAADVAADLRSWAKLHGFQVIHCLIDVHGTPRPVCKGSARVKAIAATMAEAGGKEPEELTKDAEDGELTFMRRPGYVSALKSPGLEEHLQSKGVKSLLLTGLSTSGCVLRTALAACDAEYVVTVISDGCAAGSPELHDASLKAVEMTGFVATAAQIRDGFVQKT